MKYTIAVDFSEENGVARADLAMDHPIHGAYYASAVVQSHGSHHTVSRDSDEHEKDYIDAWRALQAGIRHITAQIERDWNAHAREHGTGVR